MDVSRYGFKVVARAPQAEEDRCESFESKLLISNFVKECCAMAGKPNQHFDLTFKKMQEAAIPGDTLWYWELKVNGVEIEIEVSGTADHAALHLRPHPPIRAHRDDDYTEHAMCGVSIKDKKIVFRWNSQKSEIRDLFEVAFNKVR